MHRSQIKLGKTLHIRQHTGRNPATANHSIWSPSRQYKAKPQQKTAPYYMEQTTSAGREGRPLQLWLQTRKRPSHQCHSLVPRQYTTTVWVGQETRRFQLPAGQTHRLRTPLAITAHGCKDYYNGDRSMVKPCQHWCLFPPGRQFCLKHTMSPCLSFL